MSQHSELLPITASELFIALLILMFFASIYVASLQARIENLERKLPVLASETKSLEHRVTRLEPRQ
jgi:uncharacterized protein YoxC